MLEVIEKGSRSAQPLLFVHGGWHGAWCWENFLDYFADAGYRAVAVSLRGHGASPGPASLRWCAMSDYLLRPEKVRAWRWLNWALFDEMMASNPWARRDRGHRA
ncbi:hypothetical protein MPRG_15710 [Mycobacterium paragordonae]|uniref:AB hydrolase-1 domain-containing protein n=1 Tax=Mycobacterium paragordonae TaxID=1389713 RepID=A0ABQ1C1K3_9MYCO|nr:hypothetical protein MPRG_15710 [Mycobacterium paragordonae]